MFHTIGPLNTHTFEFSFNLKPNNFRIYEFFLNTSFCKLNFNVFINSTERENSYHKKKTNKRSVQCGCGVCIVKLNETMLIKDKHENIRFVHCFAHHVIVENDIVPFLCMQLFSLASFAVALKVEENYLNLFVMLEHWIFLL